MKRCVCARGAMGLGAVLLVLVNPTVHKVAAQASPPGKIYTNRTSLRLPITLTDQGRGQVRELALWVKQGSDPWRLAVTAQPTQKFFDYRATRDGEHWFSIVTIDQRGGRISRRLA